MRSLLLPGWGQYYNRKPVKAVLFAAGSAVLLGAAVSAQRDLDKAPLQDREDCAARRNTRFLFLALSITFSALDAYVDAHLAGFEEEGGSMHLDLEPGRAVLRLTASW